MADQTPEDGVPTPDAPTGSETPDAAPPPPAGDVSAVDAMAEEALRSANDAAEALRADVDGAAGEGTLDLPSFDSAATGASGASLAMLNDVALQVKVELGRTRMYLEDVLRLNENSVVELDKAAGDPVDIFVNDRLVARGEVLVLDDNFCVRINEIIEPVGNGE
jgi:flagellar motor switch protein FliN/FliY